MSKALIRRLKESVHEKKGCVDCGGTGRTHKGKYGGCANCAVRSTVAMVSPKDLKKAIKTLEASL